MSPTFEELVASAGELLALCRKRGTRLATAELCTGGLVAAVLTEVAGSSDVFDCGFVTYSNEAKSALIGVSPRLIESEGAVSEAVARAMAEGALAHSAASVVVSITGVAGPGGGTPAKPVGLVHLAAAARDGRLIHQELRLGDLGRSAVRRTTVAEAFALVRQLL